ncbi:transporter substrate-binding domain-containing protein [Oerskovia sp. M15]
MRRLNAVLPIAAVSTALLLAGCSSDDTPTDAGSAAATPTCEPGALPTQTDGKLTVAAGEAYSPWYIGEHDSGEGFESALVYEVADRLGYDEADVEWELVTFEQIVSPSIKTFDFAAWQTSISDERRKAVDFSSPYLTTRQGVIVQETGPYASATTLDELKDLRIGVTAAQTSLTLAKAAFGEDADLVPFNGAGDGMTALQSGTIDVMIMDVDQGSRPRPSTSRTPWSSARCRTRARSSSTAWSSTSARRSPTASRPRSRPSRRTARSPSCARHGSSRTTSPSWAEVSRGASGVAPGRSEVPDDGAHRGDAGWTRPLARARDSYRRARRRRAGWVSALSTVVVVAVLYLVVTTAPAGSARATRSSTRRARGTRCPRSPRACGSTCACGSSPR